MKRDGLFLHVEDVVRSKDQKHQEADCGNPQMIKG